MNSRGKKILKFLGLLIVGLFVVGLVFPPLLGVLICGGFMVIAAVAAYLGNIPTLILTFGVTGIVFVAIVMLLVRYARRRGKDETLQNTQENVIVQNARYIKAARAQGKSDVEIRSVFRNGGWSEESIDATFVRAGTSV